MTPVGTVLPYAGAITSDAKTKLKNDGFLFCDGSSYSKIDYGELFAVIGTIYGERSDTFCVPDYRGMFMRGCDSGRGQDPNVNDRSSGKTTDKVGSTQGDEFRSHAHWVGHLHHRSFVGANANDKPIKNCSGTSYSTGASGGTETRPKNIYVNYIICFSSYPAYEHISQYSLPFLISPEYGFRSIKAITPPKQIETEKPITITLKNDNNSFKGISIKYSSFTYNLGLNGSETRTLTLGNNEYITKISGIIKDSATINKEISYLCIQTSDNKKLESKGKETAGIGFVLNCENKKIIGLYGSENENKICCSIGAYFA